MTLTRDHHGNVVIGADDVTLDCRGHSVAGPGVLGWSGGIEVDERTGVTIRHCHVTGFEVNGIFAGGTSNSRFEANAIDANSNNGIHLDLGSGNSVEHNYISRNGGLGIVFTRMTGSRIEDNTVHDNPVWAGVALFNGSTDNDVIGNRSLNAVLGFAVENSDGNRLIDNIANGNNEGFSIFGGSAGNTFRNNLANNNIYGFNVDGATDNLFENNLVNANELEGIWVSAASDFNTFVRNRAHGNGSFDALDEDGEGNVWSDNKFGSTLGI